MAQIDGDAQTPEVTEPHGGSQSCEEAGPQQNSSMNSQAYTDERVGASDDAGGHRTGDIERDMQTREDDRRHGRIERNDIRVNQ